MIVERLAVQKTPLFGLKPAKGSASLKRQ